MIPQKRHGGVGSRWAETAGSTFQRELEPNRSHGCKSRVTRSLTRVGLFSAVVLVMAVAAGLPALAKGPSQAVIEGPGISSPVALREPGEATIGPELAAMVQKSGFFVGLWCRTCETRLDHRPPGALGRRYTVTYTMTITTKERTRSSNVGQYVFPYATPRPVTYMPADQRFWAGTRTAGGWFIARSGLRRLFVDLGLTTNATSATRAVETEAVSRRPLVERDHPLTALWLAVALGALAAAPTLIW